MEENGNQEVRNPAARGYRPFLLVMLFLSLYLSYTILRPFFDAIVFAIVLASLFHPLHNLLIHRYRVRKTLAALVIVFIITFVIAIPVFLLLSSLVGQGIQSINQTNDWIRAGNLQKLTQDPRVLVALDWLQDRLPWVDINKFDIQGTLLNISKTVGQFVISKGALILQNLATLVIHFFIMIFIIFYLVRDGRDMIVHIRRLSPLREDQEDRILDGIRLVARSVLLGFFLTALTQGAVGALGLALVGIPPVFWGSVMAFASLIPIFGTALVWVPAVIYLLLLGSFSAAMFLAAWCIVLVGSIDNFLKPILMRSGMQMSTFYVFLSILGGVQVFGLSGILYGPLILSLAMIMLYIYGVEFGGDLLSAESKAGLQQKDEPAQNSDINNY
jgi:predicted PurR-regulated permease PerM